MLVTTAGVVLLSVVLAVWAFWFAAADRPVIMRQLVLGVVVEVAIVIQAISAGVAMIAGYEPGQGLMFWGYLVVSFFLLPVAAAWAFAERTRWSSVALGAAALALLALQARLWQLWAV